MWGHFSEFASRADLILIRDSGVKKSIPISIHVASSRISGFDLKLETGSQEFLKKFHDGLPSVFASFIEARKRGLPHQGFFSFQLPKFWCRFPEYQKTNSR